MLYKSLFTLLTRSCRQPNNSITPISNLYVTHLSSNAWLGSLYKRALLGYHTYLRSLWDWNFFSLFMYHYPNGLVARENAQELIWTRILLFVLHCSYFTSNKFFIMSTEFEKNNSDWRHDYTDYKNDLDFFFRLVKWPKIAVKKSQNFQKF